jgi:hypothetical protein
MTTHCRTSERAKVRPSRCHTEKGQLALRTKQDTADAAYAFATAVLRKACGYRAVRPWIAASAFRYLRTSLPASARIFEWGSGMSTLWYERHSAEVHAVEDDPAWYAIVQKRVRSASVYLLSGAAYVGRIREFPDGYFDLISIDGSSRYECLRASIPKLSPRGLLVIDNTDKDRTTRGDLFRADALIESLPGFSVRRFAGWPPGNFFAQETTICFRHRGDKLGAP